MKLELILSMILFTSVRSEKQLQSSNSNDLFIEMIKDFQKQEIDNKEIKSKQLLPEFLKKISIIAKYKQNEMKNMLKVYL